MLACYGGSHGVSMIVAMCGACLSCHHTLMPCKSVVLMWVIGGGGGWGGGGGGG